MRVLVVDNHDSFTYNLVYMLRALGIYPDVLLNDRIALERVGEYDKVLISPGPGIPDEAVMMKSIIETWGRSKSILGICLGHQGIAEVYGAKLYRMGDVLHGITSQATRIGKTERLFDGLPERFMVTHYHSWAVAPASIPECIEVTAVNDEGIILAIAHKEWDVRGLQFHPESMMTEHGMDIIKNWIR